ncbi:MAG: glycine--tRNA ligase subunit beta, partial [Thermodesulfovibrionales bacterium]|nr:glycine--tRNA ligase subunit beta [Thermodesulfovibrionales bacterium]
ADTVRKGAERVIKARFEDARFYFEEDTKTPLLKRLEGLKNVVFHDRLGSLYNKTERIKAIADFISSRVCPNKKDEVITAALLSKTDLITGIVREFPELQGIIGSYYAHREGYHHSICQALREQYIPQHPGDALPETDTGAIISISDKIDNITSFFMIGLVPTGSEDPFALRRQAHGIILIAIKMKYDIAIYELLEVSMQNYAIKEKAQLMSSLLKFFEQRVEYIFQNEGYKADVIASLLHFIESLPLYRIKERLDTLLQFKDDPDYDSLLLAIKRVNNIAPKYKVPPVNANLFKQDEEKFLYEKLQKVNKEIQSFLKEHDYYSALGALRNLKDPINSFFDKVLVMDKDEEIKLNRLSLIEEVQVLTQQIADFSKLA